MEIQHTRRILPFFLKFKVLIRMIWGIFFGFFGFFLLELQEILFQHLRNC